MKVSRFIQIIVSFMMVVNPVMPTKLNMVEEAETDIPATVIFAIDIEGIYYTIVIVDSMIDKIERDGPENPEFIIRTDWQTLSDFADQYNDMTWLQRVKFLVTDLKIPLRYLSEFKEVIAS